MKADRRAAVNSDTQITREHSRNIHSRSCLNLAVLRTLKNTGASMGMISCRIAVTEAAILARRAAASLWVPTVERRQLAFASAMGSKLFRLRLDNRRWV